MRSKKARALRSAAQAITVGKSQCRLVPASALNRNTLINEAGTTRQVYRSLKKRAT